MMYRGELDRLKAIEKRQEEILTQIGSLKKDVEQDEKGAEVSDKLGEVMREVCRNMPFPDKDFCNSLLMRHYGSFGSYAFPNADRDQLLTLVMYIYTDGMNDTLRRVREFIGEWKE